MQQEWLPLFPLAMVLFPRTQFPLHIFEDRYKKMIGQAIRDKSEFGIVLAGEKGVASTGCTAVVEQVTQRYPDGRLDVLTVGLRRFEILDLNQDEPFLRAAVTYFNDEDTELPAAEVREEVMTGYKNLREFFAEGVPEPRWDDPQLSFQVAQVIGDLEFRQRMLMSRSESERMKLLAEFLPEHVNQQRQIQHVRAVAPRNGRGMRSST